MSSKRRLRWYKCERKVRHPTREAACILRKKLRKEGETALDIYRCQFCKGWHIGHNPKYVL